MTDLRHASQNSYSAKKWAEAADYARRAIESGVTVEDAMHLTMILCVSLTACGLRNRSQRALETVTDLLAAREISEAQATSDKSSLDFALFAAIAAGNEPMTARLYHRRLQPQPSIARVVISEARALEDFATPDVTVIRTYSSSHIMVDERAHGSEQWDYATDPMVIARVANGSFLSGWDYVATHDRIVIANSGYNALGGLTGDYPQCYVEDVGLVAHAWTDDATIVDADALFLSTPAQFHYGHWLVDFLPRLQALNIVNDPNLLIAVPTELPRKHRDLLKCFGINDDRIFNCDLGKRYQFRSLIVAQVGSYYYPNPLSVRFLRAHLGRDALNRTASSARARYFFERGAGTRLPANRDEVNAVLSAFGFRHIDLSKLSLAEEHELLADAEIIVGAHGTELLAVYGVPAGADVIELIWDVGQDPAVGPICSFLGIRHQFLVCPEAPRTAKQNYRKDRDMIVDCDELRQRISGVIARREREVTGAEKP